MSASREQLLLALEQSPVIDAGDADAAAHLICETGSSGLNVDRCSIWRLSDDGESMRCIHLFDAADGGHRDNPGVTIERADYPRYFVALMRERSIVAGDAANHPHTSEFAVGYLDVLGLGALLDGPIRQHGELVGIVCAEHRGDVRDWLPEEVSFIASLCDLYGRALTAAERRHYSVRLERLNAELEHRVDVRTAELRDTVRRLDAAREQLVEREKFAALGRLVAGIAHEVNTPIGVIVTTTSHCAGVLDELRAAHQTGSLTRSSFEATLAELGEGLEMAQRNARRAADLVDSFKRTAADRTHDVRGRFELPTLVSDVLTTLGPLLRQSRVRAELGTIAAVSCDSYPGSLGQVLTNLVVNACRHGHGDSPGLDALVRIEAEAAGERIRLRVWDNGRGMDDQTMKRAFEPFFTTARGRGGTGLGLSIVRTLVERTLGGEVRLYGDAGQGAVVELEFPRVAPA